MASPTKRNIAARMGHWSATHHKKAIWGWLALTLTAFAVGTIAGTKALKDEDTGVSESGRMEKVLATDFETSAAAEEAPEQAVTTPTA